jgi:hypothetical protein
MKLENIMLNKIRQTRKTNIACFSNIRNLDIKVKKDMKIKGGLFLGDGQTRWSEVETRGKGERI